MTAFPQRLYLKDGVAVEQARNVLRPLITEARNVVAHAGPGDAVNRLRDAYLGWVESVESQLSWLSHDAQVRDMLQTARYWHIRELQPGSVRPFPLVQREVEIQADALQRLLDDLERRVARVSAAPGYLAVLDTNVLLQYEEPWKVPWTEIVPSPQVRLVIPLRVVEELDSKKYSESGRLSGRARRLLPRIEQTVGPGGRPGDLRPGVTLEVATEIGAQGRPTDADEEILFTCHELRQLSGEEVTLVTADTGMRLRAQAQGTPVIAMPEKYLRRSAEVDERKSSRADA